MRQLDMTQGNPVKILITFAIPIFLGNVFQQFYNIMDSVIVGQFVGADALAAVGVCGAPYGVFVSFSMGIAAGIGIMISQLFGAKQEEQIQSAVINAFILITCTALFISVIGFLLTPWILSALGTPEAIFDRASIYMRMIFVGTLGMAFYNCVAGILRALGDSQTPLYFLIFSSFLNIVLNILFVTIIPWDVFGVGLATILGQAISAVAVFSYARKKYPYFAFGIKDIKPERKVVMMLMKVGLPLGLQNSTISLSGAVLQGFVNSFGEVVIAANTVIARFDNLLNMPLASLSMALATYVGQNMGAGKLERVKSGYRVSWIMAIFYSAAVFVIGHTCGGPFVRWFVTGEPEVTAYGITGIAIFSSAVISLSMIYINRSILNGAGDTRFALMNGIVEIIGRVGFAFLFVNILRIGPEGLWYTAISNWTLTGIVCMARYLSGVWKKKLLI